MLGIYNIDSNYTEFLRLNVDDRVSKNDNLNYKRTYCGIIISSAGTKFFIPMTHKVDNSKRVSSSVFRIVEKRNGKENALGMLLLNNAIPVKEGTFQRIDFAVKESDTEDEKKYKFLLQKQQRILRKYENVISYRFNRLRDRQLQGELSERERGRVCNFDNLVRYSLIFDKSSQMNQKLDSEKLAELFAGYYKKEKQKAKYNSLMTQETSMQKHLKNTLQRDIKRNQQSSLSNSVLLRKQIGRK